MDKKFWDSLVIVVVVSNALGILVLFESIIFKFPFITIFIFILYCTWSVNKKIFMKKTARKKLPIMDMNADVATNLE